jgi:hypothetical protein
MAVPMKALGDRAPTISEHRPLSSYVNALAAMGFAIDAMREIPDLPENVHPSRRRSPFGANTGFPLFGRGDQADQLAFVSLRGILRHP